MKKTISNIIIIIILISVSSCNLIKRFKRYEPPVVREQIKIRDFSEKNPPPEELESQALSAYDTAKKYENYYYEQHDSFYASVAIENYLKYYQINPDGPLAFYALYTRAELMFRIGEKEKAFNELKLIKTRKDFQKKYNHLIIKMEKLFYE